MKKALCSVLMSGVLVILVFSGCRGSSDNSAGATYTVGGVVSGLTGTIVLQDNNTDDLTIISNDTFTFSAKIADGSTYDVTVKTQPTGETCMASNNTGTIPGGNVTNVLVVCSITSIKLPKTGQTTCYDSLGSVINCANTGQDGDLQKGVAWPNPRFTDNGDGTVTDNLTGLMWLKDANCANTVKYDPDSTGNGGVTWQHALDFVAAINAGTYSSCGVGYTDWRLPNRKELRSLTDYSRYNPTLPAGHPFSNVQFLYWSSTTYASDTNSAWDVNMYYGMVYDDNKTNDDSVWPVRDAAIIATIMLPKTGQSTKYATGDDGDLQKGVAWTEPRFADNGDGTVTDNQTGLIWLKDANCIHSQYPSFDADDTAGDGMVTWQHALDFVAGINAGTYSNCGGSRTDWRLPNENELESLIDASQYSPVLPTSYPFINVRNFYWSSTTYAYNMSSACIINLFDGFMNPGYKSGNYTSGGFTILGDFYVWPVRGGQ